MKGIVLIFISLSMILLGSQRTCLILCRQSSNTYKTAILEQQTKERQLTDRKKPELADKAFEINSRLTNPERKLKFYKIIQNILKKAKDKNLEIKSIKLGSKLQSIFKNKDLKSELNKYLNDKNFDYKISKLEAQIKATKTAKSISKSRRLSISRRLDGPLGMVKAPSGLPSKSGGSKGGSGGKMNFQFLPGIAGVPFPPMMMNGPHYHPPVSVTVNSIPNPNPRSTLNPFEIEQSNLSQQVEELKGIKTTLKTLNLKLNAVDEDVETKLNEKYQRVLEIGN